MATTQVSTRSTDDIEFRPSAVGANAIGLLRWSNKLLIEDVALGGRSRGWREHSSGNGERWLRRSVEEGDCYAMESLGLRLFNGDGLDRSPTEGLTLLRRAADLGSTIAMTRLAECLLETELSKSESTEAERWLHLAMEHRNKEAALILASRLITGIGLSPDVDRGMQLLVNAARGGSQLAHVKLGVHLLSGHCLSQDRDQGLRWLRRIGAEDSNHMSLLAYHVYLKSIGAATIGSARILAEEAAVLFQEAARRGNREEEVNLAYLLRRGEISKISYPSIERLLVTHVNQEKPFALINQALRLAKGIECREDWHVADILVGKIRDGSAILSWWFARGEEGDAEGHLVTGWLVRHGLALDPDQISLAQRLNLARDGGWSVPDWMSCSANSRERT